MPPKKNTVVLIGRRLTDNENLGMGYLKSVLENAGYNVVNLYANSAAAATQAASTAITANPALVGLSLSDGGSAPIFIAIAKLMRNLGYTGHITCGGQFATLCRDWLLKRYTWLDSIIRFAGELPLVKLANSISQHQPTQSVNGLTTRKGDGAPAPVMNDLPMTTQPNRSELPEILGFKAAHITATRGCKGRCTYCGPAAMMKQEQQEAKRQGYSPKEICDNGIGGIRRRSLKDLCAEMAHLYFDKNVRYFYFVDEHLLPYKEAEALSFLNALKRNLKRSGLGPFGIGCMLRADRLTPKIIEAFAQVGLVRCFVGFELATQKEGALYGRKAPSTDNIDLLKVFQKCHIATVSNLMLVHPQADETSIEAGIDFLEAVPAGVFEATRMLPYAGTRLTERLKKEGRLTGNPFRHGYNMTNAVAERFQQIFMRLRGEAFWDYSVACRTHDVFLSLALSKKLNPKAEHQSAYKRLEHCRKQVNQLYVWAYRNALQIAKSGGGYAAADTLIKTALKMSLKINANLAGIENSLTTILQRPVQRFAPVGRAAAAAFLTFVLSGETAGCHQSGGIDEPAETDFATDSVPSSDGDSDGDGDSDADSDGDSDADSDGDSDADSDSDSDGDSDSDNCTTEESENQTSQFIQKVKQDMPCLSGDIQVRNNSVSWDLERQVNDCYGWAFICGPEQAVNQVENDLSDIAKGMDTSCIEDTITINGNSEADIQKMNQVIQDGMCEPSGGGGDDAVKVILDDSGTVVDIMHTMGANSDYIACMKDTLEGLSFPCLAEFEVCYEWLLVE